MRVFVSFLGNSDGSRETPGALNTEGPLWVTFAETHARAPFAAAHLLACPSPSHDDPALDARGKADALRTRATLAAAQRAIEAAGVRVASYDEEGDPSDISALHTRLETLGRRLRGDGVTEAVVAITSGTPAMAYALATAISWDLLPGARAYTKANPEFVPRREDQVREVDLGYHAAQSAKSRLLRLVKGGAYAPAADEAAGIAALRSGDSRATALGAEWLLRVWALLDGGDFDAARVGVKSVPDEAGALGESVDALVARLEDFPKPGKAEKARFALATALILAGTALRRIDEGRDQNAVTRSRAATEALASAAYELLLWRCRGLREATFVRAGREGSPAVVADFAPDGANLMLGQIIMRLRTFANGEIEPPVGSAEEDWVQMGETWTNAPWSHEIENETRYPLRPPASQGWTAFGHTLRLTRGRLREFSTALDEGRQGAINTGFELHYGANRPTADGARIRLEEAFQALDLPVEWLPFGPEEAAGLHEALERAL